MDNFFTQKNCDRCGKSLKDGRIQSMFNSECICMDCKKKECADSEYKKAQDATLRKFVRETITLREYEGSIYTNKGCTFCIVMVLIKSSHNGNMCTTKR